MSSKQNKTSPNLQQLSSLLHSDRQVDALYQRVQSRNDWQEARKVLLTCVPFEQTGCWRYFAFKCDVLVHTTEYLLALEAVDEALKRHPELGSEQLLVQRAAILYHLRRYEEALQDCEKAHRLAQNFMLAIIQRASILMALLRFSEAETAFQSVLVHLPKDYQTNFNYASCLFESGKLDEAEKVLKKLEKLQPGRPEPYRLHAKICASRDGRKAAIELLEQALQKAPGYLPLWEDLAGYVAAEGDSERFAQLIQTGENKHPNSNRLLLAEARFYSNLGFFEEAKASARKAIQRVNNDPDGPLTLIRILLDSGEWQQASGMLLALKKMLPDDYRVHDVEAQIHERLHQYGKAELALREAVRCSPRDVKLAYRLTTILTEVGKMDEAKALLEKIGLLRGETLGLVFNRLTTMAKTLDWSRYDEDLAFVMEKLTPQSAIALPPLSLYALPGIEPEFLRSLADEIAQTHLKASAEQVRKLEFPPRPLRKDKLKIGFASMDFRRHALAHLMIHIFETLDRDRFEVVAYSYGPDDGSDMRARLIAAFDAFHDVRTMSDVAAARKIAEDGIHILVDLAGYTRWSRVGGIFALKPAPITAHALGYAFTLGKGLVDYQITDRWVAPPGEIAERDFSEKIAYVPCVYPTDPKIPPGPPSTRTTHNLPEQAFVFCCFNQAYKIHPQLLDGWVSILKQVPASVFWVWDSSPGVDQNIKTEFARRGIDPERIIPARAVPLQEHYARLQLADLALDTTPYCSGTTGINAHWCGVPLLGFHGNIPSSRGSTSQLQALGLPELVVSGGYDEYIQRAVHLATHPDELKDIRTRLKHKVAEGSILFDPTVYAQSLEDVFEQMWERHEQGLPPDHLYANGSKVNDTCLPSPVLGGGAFSTDVNPELETVNISWEASAYSTIPGQKETGKPLDSANTNPPSDDPPKAATENAENAENTTKPDKPARLQRFLNTLGQFEQAAHYAKADTASQLMRETLQAYHAYSEDGSLALFESPAFADQIYTRYAAAITQWALRTDLNLSYPDYLFLCRHKPTWASLFTASGFRAMTHFLDIQASSLDEKRQYKSEQLPALVGLLRLDDTPQDILEFVLTQEHRIALPAIIGWLNERQILTKQGENNRARLLTTSALFAEARLPTDEIEALLDPLAVAWMYCSYAVTPDRHDIKIGMNQFLRQNVLTPWQNQPLPARPERTRLRLLVIHERWTQGHAMYRCFAPLMQALKPHFEMWSIGRKAHVALEACDIFEQPLIWDDLPFENLVEYIRETIAPDVIYYPSIGMSLPVILLANLRLAPVQFASLGHTGTHHLADTIDFICEFGLKAEHQPWFAERLLPVLPDPVYHPHSGLPDKLPEYTRAEHEPVRIGVHGKVMKLNHTILDIIIQARQQTTRPTEVHFFPGERGAEHDGLVKAIRLQIPDAIVHPPYSYPIFLEHLSRIDVFVQTWPFGSSNSFVDCMILNKSYIARTDTELLPAGFKSVLTSLGLKALLTESQDETLARLVDLIEHAEYRQAIRSRLQQPDAKVLLFDHAKANGSLEDSGKIISHYIERLLG